MVQLAQPVEPFGEVNAHRRLDGGLDIVATILMEPDIEGARAGLALDASASMKKMYGAASAVSPLFKSAAGVNYVEPVARTMASYLARFSSNGQVQILYWACSPDGSQIEPIGTVGPEQIAHLSINGPRKTPWGRGTKLLPPLRYFIEEAFRDAPWAMAVFVTDGIIEDIDAVMAYSRQFANQVADGSRSFIKLVLLGVGEEVDEKQMELLDDMFEEEPVLDRRGQPIDLWDHKLAKEMRQLTEIFAEVVTADMMVAEWGKIYDDRGRLVQQFSDGLPAILRFRLPAGAQSFTLEIPSARIEQDLTEALARI